MNSSQRLALSLKLCPVILFRRRLLWRRRDRRTIVMTNVGRRAAVSFHRLWCSAFESLDLGIQVLDLLYQLLLIVRLKNLLWSWKVWTRIDS